MTHCHLNSFFISQFLFSPSFVFIFKEHIRGRKCLSCYDLILSAFVSYFRTSVHVFLFYFN